MERTLYFCLSSLERGADMNLRRMWDGALKYLSLFLRREEVLSLLSFMVETAWEKQKQYAQSRIIPRHHLTNIELRSEALDLSLSQVWPGVGGKRACVSGENDEQENPVHTSGTEHCGRTRPRLPYLPRLSENGLVVFIMLTIGWMMMPRTIFIHLDN